jgi:hypothetical protein
MILSVKEFYSNNLNYEINPQSTGIAIGEDGKEYYFSYCRTVFANCFIKEINSDKLIHGNFHFYANGLIEFNLW